MQAALSKIKGIDHANIKVGKVTFSGSATPEEVANIIESETPFKVATD